jgi:hypothetical protein
MKFSFKKTNFVIRASFALLKSVRFDFTLLEFSLKIRHSYQYLIIIFELSKRKGGNVNGRIFSANKIFILFIYNDQWLFCPQICPL